METRRFWCHYIGNDGNTPKRAIIELTKFDLVPSITDQLSQAKCQLWYKVEHDGYKPDDPNRDLYYIYMQINDKVCLKARNVVLLGCYLAIMRASDEDIDKYHEEYYNRRIAENPNLNETGIARERQYTNEHIKKDKERRDRYIDELLYVAMDYTDYLINKGTWVSTADIAAYKDAGLSAVALLLQIKRDKCMAIRQKKIDERKAKEEEEMRNLELIKQEKARKEEERIAAECEKFKNGGKISGEDVASLCRRYGIEIHLRTIHNLQQNVCLINGSGFCSYYKIAGKRRPVLDGCYVAAEKLYKKLNETTQQSQTTNV